MGIVIDGLKISKEFNNVIAAHVSSIRDLGVIPKIALINASSDPASAIYVRRKMELAKSLGIESSVYKFHESVGKSELTDLIDQLNADNSTHAILLQSPLAHHLSFRELINKILPNKDVDGLTTINQGKLFAGEAGGVVPCTPLGVLHLIKSVHSDITGMYAVIIGRSSIVGRPLSQLLINNNCSVTCLHSYSKNLEDICRSADILVCAAGKPQFINSSFIKPGATVIDVGINRIMSNGQKKIVGDVDFEDVINIAGAITPVPNGVGPMTVTYLMHNAVKLAYSTLSDK